MSERKFGAMQPGAAQRWIVQARYDPHSAPAICGLLEQNATAAHGEAVILGAKLEAWARFLSRKGIGISCAAETLYWTYAALWTDAADERTELHQSGVLFARVSFWQ